ncbi:MAG: hypothetical protein CVV24_08105, partial [Ignavibacteriae bacterium HGW-Ignavibacteriae-3]
MVFLPFPISKYFKIFPIITLSLFLSGSSIYSQIKIKEKVVINPELKKNISQLKKISNPEPLNLWVQVSGQSSWSAVLEGPCGTGVSAEGLGGKVKYLSIENPPVGTYRIKLTQYFPDYGGMPTAIGYVAGYTGFSSDSASFSHAAVYQGTDGSETTELSFNLNYLNDFEIEALGGYGSSCGETNSIVRVKRLEEVADCSKIILLNSEPVMMMSFTIQSQTEDLVFRDVRADTSLGRSVTIPAGQGNFVGLMLKQSFRGIPETATVIAEINGVVRATNVFVDTYPPYDPAIYTTENDVAVVYGTSKKNTIVLDYDICSETEPPESTKFNLEIVEGNQFGHLKDPVTGILTNSLTNLSNQGGKREFEFIADGQPPAINATVVIKITGTDVRLGPCYVTYFIKPNKIQVTFEPSNISAGDTANVVL